MTKTRIHRDAVNLPANAPVNTKAALEKLAQYKADVDEAWRARDATSRAAREAESKASSAAIPSYLNTGKIERNTIVADAKKEAEEAQADLTALIAVESAIAGALHAAIAADESAWTASAHADAKKALTKLTTAARMAQDAADALYSSVGVLGLYRRRETGERPLAIVHSKGSYFFDLNAGLEGIRTAIGKASSEVERLKPGKAKKTTAPTIEADTDGFDDDDLGGDDD